MENAAKEKGRNKRKERKIEEIDCRISKLLNDTDGIYQIHYLALFRITFVYFYLQNNVFENLENVLICID